VERRIIPVREQLFGQNSVRGGRQRGFFNHRRCDFPCMIFHASACSRKLKDVFVLGFAAAHRSMIVALAWARNVITNEQGGPESTQHVSIHTTWAYFFFVPIFVMTAEPT